MSLHSLEEKYRYYSLGEGGREEVLNRIRGVLEKHDVGLAIIFGSFLSGNAFRDIDVAVYSKELKFDDLLKLRVELELELGMPIDLVPLDQLPPKFRLEVLRRGMIIIEKNGVYEHLYMKTYDELISMKPPITEHDNSMHTSIQ